MSKSISIKDVAQDKISLAKQDLFKTVLNQNPDPKWVKRNKYANNSLYLPVERVEWLMKSIFKTYQVEVRNIEQVFNGIMCTVRVHYRNPVSGKMEFQDGVGAGQIQTKQGKSPADLTNINNNAIQLCVPIAKTEAFKNACKNFGKLFGSDLNRKQKIQYSQDSTLLPLDENHPNWEKCCQAIESGKYTVEDIQSKYDVEPEALELLKNIG